jgi:hypothetical protein
MSVTILLIIAGILLELIVLVGGVYLGLKYFRKSSITSDKIEVKVSGKSITSDVIRDGVKSALQEMAYEEKQEKIHDKKMRAPERMYSTSPQDEPVRRSGGNLVPYGLSDSEKAALEMFYDN